MPDLYAAGREWLAELEWRDDPDFDTVTDYKVRRVVDHLHDGGWAAFVRAEMAVA